jgi:hypothetical protein
MVVKNSRFKTPFVVTGRDKVVVIGSGIGTEMAGDSALNVSRMVIDDVIGEEKDLTL